ncbi:19350_t:CDS:2, partial [Racocetra persica]
CQNLCKRPRSVMQESFSSTSKDSIGNAGGFLPFWNEYTLKESKKWWLPEKTIFVTLDPNLWNRSLKKLGYGSWYSHDIIDYTLLPIAKEEKKPPKRFKSSKKKVIKLPAGKKDLRAQCLNAINFQNKTELEWILETPYNIRGEAMNNLLKGYASNFATNHKNFKMKFHSKKDQQQSITILSKHWSKSHAKSLSKQLEYDSRLVINRLSKFYLCIPELLKIRAENQGPLFSENQEKIYRKENKRKRTDRKSKQLLDKKVGVSTVNEFVNTRSKDIKAIKVDKAFIELNFCELSPTSLVELNFYELSPTFIDRAQLLLVELNFYDLSPTFISQAQHYKLDPTLLVELNFYELSLTFMS